MTALDDTVQLAARGFDAQGATVSVGPLQWSSTASTIAAVSATGLVSANGNGVASISASSGTISGTIQVTVTQSVVSVALAAAPTTFRAIGATADLSVTVKDRNGHPVATTVTWSSSDPAVIDVNGDGRVTAVGVGTATVRATAGNKSASVSIEVATVRRVAIDSFLATPAPGAVWEVPVVLVAYIPTADGVNLDLSQSPDFYTLNPRSIAAVEADILDFARRKKMAREEGSKFRGYKNTSALPSLGFRVVEHIIVYTQIPGSPQMYAGVHLPDYHKAFAELDLASLITDRSVKEVWLAVGSFDANVPSYNPSIHDLDDARFVFESNMASPTAGDISNSNRDPSDLPVLSHTYTVYGMNFRRSQAEAVHNVGHQLEAMFAYVNQRTEGNTNIFWKQFVGQNAGGAFVTGRAGWTHMPPNTTVNYDYLNATLVKSDIEDWRPDGGGVKKAVNVNTWGNLTFPWPGAMEFPQRVETQWYIYWFQSMPGLDNHIPRGSGEMTNWWRFVGDWDRAIQANVGLSTVSE
ncbi:MAG TPA: Ig-like domain-containing protein [Gammaproteobacteria bacterium]|nr:Ig-like domain-containing protein [Gammaproteobacteria bacterium]